MQLLVYIIAYPLLWIIASLPFRLFYLFSDFVYFLVYRVFKYRKNVVVENIKMAFPEKSDIEVKRITKKFYEHMCDLFLEMIKSLRISEKEIKKRFYVNNAEAIDKYAEAHQSVQLICGHFASYEWAMSLEYHIAHKGFAVYTPLGNKYFDRLVQKIRKRHNAELISRYDSMATIQMHHDTNVLAMYGMASDQSPMPMKAKYWRDFFGINVPVHTGVEFMAKKFNQAVVFIDIQKVKRGYYTATFKEITATPNDFPDYEITDIFTDMLEAQIRKAPEYYLWTHKRFKHRDKQAPGIVK